MNANAERWPPRAELSPSISGSQHKRKSEKMINILILCAGSSSRLPPLTCSTCISGCQTYRTSDKFGELLRRLSRLVTDTGSRRPTEKFLVVLNVRDLPFALVNDVTAMYCRTNKTARELLKSLADWDKTSVETFRSSRGSARYTARWIPAVSTTF